MRLPPEFLMCLNGTQAAQQKLAEQQRDQSYQQQEPQQQGQNPFGQVCGLVGRNRKDERFKSSSSSGEREADESFESLLLVCSCTFYSFSACSECCCSRVGYLGLVEQCLETYNFLQRWQT
jgi:hypothetical protein